uniref:Putative secreted protein n=1 Tax=Amblyomma cajennense TaxID=34607 RepID=A0A023FC07_AMBCJ
MKILFVFPFLTAGSTCSVQVSTHDKCPADHDCARNHDHFGRQHSLSLVSTAQTDRLTITCRCGPASKLNTLSDKSLHTTSRQQQRKLLCQTTPKCTVHSLQGKKRGRNKYVVGPSYRVAQTKQGGRNARNNKRCCFTALY